MVGIDTTAAEIIVIETARLRLRRLHEGDAGFILELLNEPGWLRFIGDRGVRDLDAAHAYLRDGPMAMYARHGFGLYAVERSVDGVSLGLCGPLRREALADADLGFAFLARHGGQGYAQEAAQATMRHVREDLGLARLVAITLPENARSIRVLEAVGFAFEQRIHLSGDGEELCLYGAKP